MTCFTWCLSKGLHVPLPGFPWCLLEDLTWFFKSGSFVSLISCLFSSIPYTVGYGGTLHVLRGFWVAWSPKLIVLT